VVLKVVKTTRRLELCGNVREYVLEGSTAHTDALMSYDDLLKDYDRQIMDHLESYAKGQRPYERFGKLLVASQTRSERHLR
jgi:ISXO2-like transposase domain